MDRNEESGALRPLSLAWSQFSLTYQVLATILVAGLFYKLALKERTHKVFPVWATLEIALVNYILRGDGVGRRIYSILRRYGGSLFGFTGGHQVLADLPGVDRLMSHSSQTLTAEPVQYALFTRVFGAPNSPELRSKLERACKGLVSPVERLFLNDAAATEAIERGCIPRKAASFVTFSATRSSMQRWELAADIRVISPDSLTGESGQLEANFQSLVRDFGACLAIPQLYGSDFLERYTHLLDDFWRFDNDLFPLLTIGVPTWTPLKMVREGLAARSRLLDELSALYRRIDQYQRGLAVDYDADMSDVSSVAFERNKVYQRDNWSFQERGAADFGLLWGQNANTQPLIFWFLTFVYSTPGLLEKIRDETAPYVSISQAFPPSITSMDLAGLSRNCQLMKACIFETYRMANEATSIRYVSRPITVPDGAYKHELKAGTFVSAPHALIQRNPSVYPDPDKFVPDRFLQADPDTGKTTARYGKLKPWGSGAAMCKGRTFAEKEIVAVGTAIISLWDIAPASGSWKLPGMIPGAGAKKPVKDIRVVITRRRFS